MIFDACLDEIRLRDPDYLKRFPLELPLQFDEVPCLSGVQTCGALTVDEILDCLNRAVTYWSSQGVSFRRREKTSDPVSEMLFTSLLDKLAAIHGLLDLPPDPTPSRPIRDILSNSYDARPQPDERRAFIRRRGTRNLVLISALGIPMSVWSHFLEDESHAFRIILIEGASSDFLEGGMSGQGNISEDALRIAHVLEQHAITDATVVGWCNGGRVALELAARSPKRVASLVLLSTTHAGMTAAGKPHSAFEESLNVIFKTLSRQQHLAKHLASTLQPAPLLDWQSVAEDPEKRAKMLFRLPAKQHLQSLFAPFATGESLLNYVCRCDSDLRYDVDASLAQIRQPIMLITGDSDNIVNNQLTVASLRRAGVGFTHVNLSGAGHYINDLQYPYFLWALNHWHGDREKLRSTARVVVDQVSGRE